MASHALSYGLCVQDDAFISFRYAANLAAGDGLVFNPGEPVEGYTNFLWTVLLAGALAVGLDPIWTSVLLGLASTLGLLWVTWALARALMPEPRLGLALAAPAFLVVHTGLALESVQGLESSTFSLLLALALLATVREVAAPARPPLSFLWLALAALTRPEGVLAFALLTGTRFLLARGRLGGRAWAGIAAFLAVVAAHEVFRLAYYGDFVPNTFHAKVGGGLAAVGRGLHYVASFARDHLGLSLLSAMGLLATPLLARTHPRLLLPAILCLCWLAYVVTVGGDFKGTGRFLLPLLGPLLALGVAALSVLPRLPRQAPEALAAILLGLAVARDLPRTLSDARAAADFRADDMTQRLLVGQWLRAHVPPDSLLAIHSAGTIPYASGLPTIDLWGLSDRHIARVPVEGMGTGTAGHEKKDYAYAFGRQPVLYLPEEDLLTPEPVRLPVPSDFPPDFEEHYRQMSVRLETGWLNFFHRAGWTLSPPAAP